jgi:hypothetical protein
MTEHNHNNGHAAYETEDFSVSAIIGSLVALGVIGIAVYFIVLGMYKFLDRYEAEHVSENPMVAAEPDTRKASDQKIEVTFPSPRLQKDDVKEMRDQLEAEENLLHRYSWVDEAGGTARIPIDRAIELTAERGLPVRQNASPANAPPAKAAPAAKAAAGAKAK